MSAERHTRRKQLFLAALERPRADRAAFLQQQCGDDAALLAEVQEMLAVEDGAPDFLESSPITGPILAAAADPPQPAQIGPFRILRLLGEGGMGAVYEAEQERPHRKVALKVLHPAMATPQMLRRFELESEVLGRLEHPGIARIYEAGTNDTGRGPQPWFAMELVDGQPLTEHCAARALPLEQRIELLASVCDAVQHAHQRGIVHRDLKPANILIDKSGQPKVLDFGIARAIDGELQRATLRTDPGTIVGTLQYMSPEQATVDPDAIDVRTDVYSLGVLLYELAAGRPPLDLARLPMPEALRRLLETEPAPLRSSAQVPTDIAVIAHKALSKDKDRRYATAAELGADLRRTLRCEPILARPASHFYQLRKFARRHKGLTAGVALAVLALVTATIVSLVQVRVADAARDFAVRAACRASIAAATVAAEHADFAACRHLLDSVAPDDRNWEWCHLASRADRTLARVEGTEPFLDAVLAPSGDELAAVTRTGAVLRWRLPDLEPLGGTHLDEVPTGPAVFRRDGSALAAVLGPQQDRVGVFDAASGRRVAQVAAPETGVSLLAVAQDGARIAFAGRAAYLWDPAGGGSPKRIHGHDFKSLCFSGDGLRFAGGFGPPPDGAGYFLAYDARTAAPIGGAQHDSYLPVAGLALDGDGARLAVAYGDKKIRLFDVGAGRLLDGLAGHRGAVRCVAFDPRGERLASAADDETIRLWQLHTNAETAVLGGLLGQPRDIAFSADGSRVLARTDREIALWSTEAGRDVLSGHPSYVYGVAFAAGGARIVSASYEGMIRIWAADSGDALWERSFASGAQAVAAAAAAPVFASVHNPVVRLWDADAGEVIREFDAGKGAGVVKAGLSADGSLLAARGEHAVFLWNTRTGELVHRWPSPSYTWYRAVAISPGGERVAADSGRGSILLWSVATGAQIARLAGHTAPVEGLAFSADGALLASGASDRTVRLWDARTGAPRWASTGHTDSVFALAFSPDGSRLASGSNDTTVILWDVASGVQVALLSGHADYVFALAFSPDGSRLVSGSGDRTLRVWDAEPMRSRWLGAEHVRRLRAEVEAAVRALLASEGGPAGAAARLRADPALDPLLREASIQSLLRLTGGLPQAK
jgi:WD40 repeat protein